MKEFFGIRMFGYQPSKLSDSDLLKQIITVARIDRFLYGIESPSVVIDPIRMSNNYGDLLCTDKLQPLVDEAWRRAKEGSNTVQEFFAIAYPILKKFGGDPTQACAFINSVDKLSGEPMISRKYYGPIVVETKDAPVRNNPLAPYFRPFVACT